MSIAETGIALLGIGCYIVYRYSQNERDNEEFLRCCKEANKNIERLDFFKDFRKKQYINNFIDEIPDLSYYEAKQLQKKLGNIYVEWNDE